LLADVVLPALVCHTVYVHLLADVVLPALVCHTVYVQYTCAGGLLQK